MLDLAPRMSRPAQTFSRLEAPAAKAAQPTPIVVETPSGHVAKSAEPTCNATGGQVDPSGRSLPVMGETGPGEDDKAAARAAILTSEEKRDSLFQDKISAISQPSLSRQC